jgi:hypothetical protein
MPGQAWKNTASIKRTKYMNMCVKLFLGIAMLSLKILYPVGIWTRVLYKWSYLLSVSGETGGVKGLARPSASHLRAQVGEDTGEARCELVLAGGRGAEATPLRSTLSSSSFRDACSMSDTSCVYNCYVVSCLCMFTSGWIFAIWVILYFG